MKGKIKSIYSSKYSLTLYEILKSYDQSKIKILMHCFTGSYNFAEKLMSFNTYFSASGIITFKNSSDSNEPN